MPKQRKQLIAGEKHGRLSYVSGELFECECGNRITTSIHKVLSGHTSSCGCLQIEMARKANTTHGLGRSSEYLAWTNMRTRCGNPRYDQFYNYGGRGISVCAAWATSFERFLLDVGRKPNGEAILDRINPDGNYEPGNVRWVTPIESARNKRSVRKISIDGQEKTLPEWELVSPVCRKVIWRRLKDGWSERDAIFLPPQSTRRHAA